MLFKAILNKAKQQKSILCFHRNYNYRHSESKHFYKRPTLKELKIYFWLGRYPSNFAPETAQRLSVSLGNTWHLTKHDATENKKAGIVVLLLPASSSYDTHHRTPISYSHPLVLNKIKNKTHLEVKEHRIIHGCGLFLPWNSFPGDGAIGKTHENLKTKNNSSKNLQKYKYIHVGI